VTIQKQGPPHASDTTKARGDQAELMALTYLRQQGLRALQRNFRTPGRGGGEIDLIMAEPDGTLVFVEVRHRARVTHGGAGASVSVFKQRRIIFAARHYLLRCQPVPPCRFDVVAIDGALEGPVPPRMNWLRGAFDASGWV
jgi:putative endonuclease